MRNMKAVKDPEIQNILQMPCKFEDYEVVYDDAEQLKYIQRKAKQRGVKVTAVEPNQTDYETCEGTVENCIRFLRDYIEADYGYQAGLAFVITKAPKTPKFRAAFKRFIDWLSASERFQDFGKGVSEGKMSAYLK